MSAYQIQNPKYQALLYTISRCFDNPSHPLNRATAYAYKSIAPVLIKQYLKFYGHDLVINLRHSVNEKQNFHCTFSDLDVTIVAPDQSHKQAVLLMRGLRKRLPFLGESEVYSAQDLLRKDGLEKNLSGDYERIRNTRKLAWLINTQNTCPSDYHRAKNQRAMRITVGKLGLSEMTPTNLLSAAYKELADIILPDPVTDIVQLLNLDGSYLHHYLGRDLSMNGHAGTVNVTRETCARLLIALPIHYTGDPALDCRLVGARKKYGVLRFVEQLAEIELLTYRSYLKSKGEVNASERAWESEVLAILESCKLSL